MTTDEQLQKWLDGDSVHNDERGECCPDFSCCRPELFASEAERKAFVDADDKSRSAMLFGFLGKAISTYTGKKVHVTSAEKVQGEQ